MQSRARSLVVMSVLGSLACVSPDSPGAVRAGLDRRALEGDPSPKVFTPPPAEPSPTGSVAGKWRLIAEEAADNGGGISGQERRLLELGEDGRFHVENYLEARDGEWTLAGDELILGDVHTRVEVLEVHRLVLIEALPEAYLRGGSPRKVRNTYRRISESELGPMLGAQVVTSAPAPGTYAGAYEYGMSKFPTMEISVTKSVRGRARLELGANGTMTGCFGVATDESFSESEYSSRDGKRHTRADDNRRLIAVRGAWVVEQGRARVTASEFWLDTCETDGQVATLGPIEFDCVAVARTERLPVDALACRIVHGHSMLEEMAINPADTERSGPYTMQIEPRGHLFPDEGRPWLILGGPPGLHVRSVDDRMGKQPEVSFTSEAVDFVEDRFRPLPTP